MSSFSNKIAALIFVVLFSSYSTNSHAGLIEFTFQGTWSQVDSPDFANDFTVVLLMDNGADNAFNQVYTAAHFVSAIFTSGTASTTYSSPLWSDLTTDALGALTFVSATLFAEPPVVDFDMDLTNSGGINVFDIRTGFFFNQGTFIKSAVVGQVVSQVPEPTTAMLIGLGLLGLVTRKKLTK